MSTEPTGYKKKLIEVALPLDEINKQSAREKSIRHGHPSTLHLWWARRPLAACRAVLFAQLVDDPSSRPDEFPTEEDQAIERKRLFTIIERLVNWDNINDKALYEEARKEIWKSCDGNPPPILDPFAGGGSIPLEAQRLGLEAHASDLNPVPVLINKALIEIPPKWADMPPVFPGAAEERLGDWPGATGLAEDVRRYGKWMRDEAEKRIGHLYPKAKLEDGTEANVIAWIWARTVICPNPACGGNMPLVSSFWLSKKKGRERYVEAIVEGKKVRFEVRGPSGKPQDGTVKRTIVTCLICGSPAKRTYVAEEGKAGRLGVQLMALVAEGHRTRFYVSPSEEQVRFASTVRPENVPDAGITKDVKDVWCVNYGLDSFDKLFTDRQLVALATFSDLVSEAREEVMHAAMGAGLPLEDRLADGGRGAAAYADSVAMYLAFAVDKAADYWSASCSWHVTGEKIRNTFGRQALPIAWDFAETFPFSGSTGNWTACVDWVWKALALAPAQQAGKVQQCSANTRAYGGMVVATDPPYYDNISYADLSDYFYVWLRRSVGQIFPSVLGTLLTPKTEELVAKPYLHGGKGAATQFFEDGFRQVFSLIRREASDGFPMTVFYAFKQSEIEGDGRASTGWETLLEGMIGAGWSVTATWPVRTELGVKVLGIGKNILASSIVLACRPRSASAHAIDRRGLIRALKMELPEALRDLQQGGVAPVDLAQAAIGPGMAVFSRYSKVNEADGTVMRVRSALGLINQILAEVLSNQEGDFDADTRFCIKWFETYGFDIAQRKFGEADVLARAMDTSVEGLERGGVLKARAGDVRLFSPAEMPDGYDPSTDERISIWEVVMHLARRLDEGGIDPAARLMAAAKRRVDLDTAKELTYLLYSICERRKWAETGLLFNELGAVWSEIEKAARTVAPLGDVQVALEYRDED